MTYELNEDSAIQSFVEWYIETNHVSKGAFAKLVKVTYRDIQHILSGDFEREFESGFHSNRRRIGAMRQITKIVTTLGSDLEFWRRRYNMQDFVPPQLAQDSSLLSQGINLDCKVTAVGLTKLKQVHDVLGESMTLRIVLTILTKET